MTKEPGSQHVVQQVLEITAQKEKYAIRRLQLWGSVSSLGTNWSIPNRKHTFKKKKNLCSSFLLKYTLPPTGDNSALLSAVKSRIIFQARTIANPAQMNTNQVKDEIAEKDLNPGHHKEKNAQFHINQSIGRQLSPTVGW